MPGKALIVVPPDPRKHREEMFDLVSKTFSQGGYFDFMRYCRKGYIDHSNYSYAASRIGLMDGRIVTHWGVWDHRMRIGSAVVLVGGIGVVSTHGEYRKRGLMDRTARAGIEAMRQMGYDMTALLGISNFYHRFGYVRWSAPSTCFVGAGDLPKDPPPAGLRRFPGHHRPDTAALYNRQNAVLTGTAVRPTYLLNRRPESWMGFLWTGRRRGGKVAGYVVVRKDGSGLECLDQVGPADQVLRALGAIARRQRCQEVRFPELHYESDLARLLRAGNCRVETRYVRRGGPMIRTLNLRGVLTKISGELARRLRGSYLANWRGKLLIADPREKVVLDVKGGLVGVSDGSAAGPHVIRGGEEIAQLLVGTDEPREIIEGGKMKLTGDARRLAEVLFPNRHPVLNAWDAF